MRIIIAVEVEDGDPNVDEESDTGLTGEAYNRLTGDTSEHGFGALAWLGEVAAVTALAPDEV